MRFTLTRQKYSERAARLLSARLSPAYSLQRSYRSGAGGAQAARELLNKSENERSGVLSTTMSFLRLYRDPTVAEVTSSCDWRIADLIEGEKPISLYLVVPPSDISHTKPLVRLILNQIEKAYGPNNSILDNRHVRVAFATNDERTAKRISDALGSMTEMRAMRDYTGHRLAPRLGHVMVSRRESARQLLTPGEIMQLPPDGWVWLDQHGG